MASPVLNSILRNIGHRVAHERQPADTDAMLLERFFKERESEAFELLLRRHGPMVLGVCRRILAERPGCGRRFPGHLSDPVAQGRAFRSARQAGQLAVHGGLPRGPARKLNRTRRRDCERQAMALQTCPHRSRNLMIAENCGPSSMRNCGRLPENYRTPVVLCYLQGLTQEAAAHALGWPPGTVFSRLARARERLRGRSSRRGIALPAGVLGTLWLADAAAALPPALLASTSQMAAMFSVGKLATAGCSLSAVTLAEGVLQTMWRTKMKIVAIIMAATVALAGSGTLALRAFADRLRGVGPARPPGPSRRSGQARRAHGPVRPGERLRGHPSGRGRRCLGRRQNLGQGDRARRRGGGWSSPRNAPSPSRACTTRSDWTGCASMARCASIPRSNTGLEGGHAGRQREEHHRDRHGQGTHPRRQVGPT